MERQREVKALLKRWEADFLRERQRKPSQADIEEAPEDTRRLYKEYKMLKKQREESDPPRPEPPDTPTAEKVPENVPNSGCWGAHLNRQPKTPAPNRSDRSVPKSSVQYYGMKLKSNLGTAEKETPLTPRRIPRLPKNLVTSAKRPSPPPTEAPQSEGDLVLPPSVSGLAPLILTAGLKPKPPPTPPNKYQRLKKKVAETLGSVDAGWLRRCQGTLGDKETVPRVAQDRGDSGRKRPRGDEDDEDEGDAAAPTPLKRCCGSTEGAFGNADVPKRNREGVEEHVKAPKMSEIVPDPSQNLLEEEEEEEEKNKPTRRTSTTRAAPRNRQNFVRLNLKRKTYVRGFALRGNRLRKQMWKQKWRKKAKWFGGGGGSSARSSDVCFKCGATGHWASECRGLGKANSAPLPEDRGGADDEEDEDDLPLPTLEEVARRTNSICRDLSGTGDNGENSENIPEVPMPPYEPPAPPAPVEPLYALGPEGKVQETPREVFEALKTLGYSSFRPGQEVAVMRILSGLSTLVVLSTGMGKSLCYQLPAYLYHKRSKCITLVVSPLVSLMDDQVSGLPPCLSAVCIHSNMPKTQRDAAMEKVRRGEAQVLLLSPEALVGGGAAGCGYLPGADRLPPVAFACVDEAHCVSEWSHNFRPCYLRLCKVLRDRLGVRCFLGLTATATLATARDVAQHLGVPPEEGVTVRSAAVPPNLRLSVSLDTDRDQALLSLLRGERFGRLDSIIVYCTRREETTRVAALIRTCLQGTTPAGRAEPGQDAAPRSKAKAKTSARPQPPCLADAYHAGLTPAERRRVQKSFMSGRLRMVVATVAFGMGLDKPDVRGVIHYNMPKNFESYVQEIGRAGRDGEPAHCHLFLDPEGGDLHELRRHIHGDAVDFYAIQKLVQKVFAPCKCLELHRKHRDAVRDGELEDAEIAEFLEEEEDGAAAKPSERRVCYKHERAIPIQETVEALDLREEGIETLLCYLELHPCRWLELLPPTYSSCHLRCYGGHRQLRAAARCSPPVAVALARERLAGKDRGAADALEFDVVALSDSMGWEPALVKRALRQLQWDPWLRRGDRGVGKNGILVEFGNLSFHLRAYGDLAAHELDSICDFLHRRVVGREKAALAQLRACFRAFRSVAFQSCGPHGEEEEEERSSRLKALLSRYFETEPAAHGEEEEEEEEALDAAQRQDWENQIRADVRHFLAIRHDEMFTGRAIARIFHGIGSPCFPADIYGRDRRFWRKHLAFDFHRLIRLATEEILASR
ncbi:ATP-dependent DNA helicase Q4 isoform X1 [Columba livia]|uniref:ATP-dependent DNA helicase Q4 isoform X1 n=1 Tax=Columba livia TaxID=8932 RepID=UPI0031BA6EC8